MTSATWQSRFFGEKRTPHIIWDGDRCPDFLHYYLENDMLPSPMLRAF